MLIGLIFGAGAKHKRSLMAWRDEKSVLPRNATGSTWKSHGEDVESVEEKKGGGGFGLGFGRQGEKAAGIKGVFLYFFDRLICSCKRRVLDLKAC